MEMHKTTRNISFFLLRQHLTDGKSICDVWIAKDFSCCPRLKELAEKVKGQREY
jgi:hypothetical protein